MPKVFIEESPILDDIVFNIRAKYNIRVKCENGEPVTIVSCWDYNLAETLLKSVKEYLNVR